MATNELPPEPDIFGPGLVHEMRHPLMGIKAGLELLARKMGVAQPDEFRLISQQVARLEERAARLPVLLAIPMMMFILPCLMIVIGTPVALRIGDTFQQVFFRGQ